MSKTTSIIIGILVIVAGAVSYFFYMQSNENPATTNTLGLPQQSGELPSFAGQPLPSNTPL